MLNEDKNIISADFNNPVRTLGGAVWDNVLVEGLDPGPIDQKPVNRRDDVLRMYTDEFREDITFAGNTTVRVTAGTTVPNSHITAKLNILDSEGVEYVLQDGIKIISEHYNNQELEIRLDFSAFSISKGEKLMIELSWSNYPKYARPLHTKNYEITLDTSKPVVLRLEKYE